MLRILRKQDTFRQVRYGVKAPTRLMPNEPRGRWVFRDGMWVPNVAGGAVDMNYGMDEVHYGFHGDLIPDELATTSDTGTITCNVGLSGGAAGRASILRLDNSNNTDNDMAEVDFGALNYQVQDGQMYMAARVLLERTVCAVNVGFNDETTESSNTLPAELSGTTWTSNASTWVGFVYDSDATNDNWHIFWVDGDSDTSVAIATLNSGIAVAAGVFYYLFVQLFDNGSGNKAKAQFHISDGTNTFDYRTGTGVETITRSTALVPHIGVENRSATGAYLDIDDIWAGKSRYDTAP
jgi:hypothetical protein